MQNSEFEVWYDRIVIGGLLFLLLFTPFAFGAVHPWAFSIMEAVIFLLVAVWMWKIRQGTKSEAQKAQNRGEASIGNWKSEIRFTTLALPIVLFIVWVALQLIPLPPSALRVLSPQTFELYRNVLPGWPGQLPYTELETLLQGARSGEQEAAAGDTVRGEELGVSRDNATNAKSAINDSPSVIDGKLSTPRVVPGPLLQGSWRSLSIAPSLTRGDLLKFVAYAALFFLVLLYPPSERPSAIGHRTFQNGVQSSEIPSALHRTGSGQRSGNRGARIVNPEIQHPIRSEERFVRSLLLVILSAGLTVAFVGIAQRFSWNGKILWFFVPYDWGAPLSTDAPRASGPFVNPDHFANYLALIFPIALACTLFSSSLVKKPLGKGLRLISGLIACLLFTGILLSLSRAGWMSVLLGVVTLLWFSPVSFGGITASKGERRGRRLARTAAVVLCSLLVVSLFFSGPAGRQQVNIRLGETVTQDAGLWGRTSLWQDTLAMVSDFPLFGVGLGAWPELFPRYRRPPWSDIFYREAHNDYVEILAETGVLGFAFLACFFFLGGKKLLQGQKRAPRGVLPLVAALLSSLGVMAFHEAFDFSLQIPANALLFTVLFALALRMVGGDQISEAGRQDISRFTPYTSMLVRVAIGVVALILVICSVMQEQTPYPYNLPAMKSLAQAKRLIPAHPTRAEYHLALLRLAGLNSPLPWQLSETKIGLSLDPTNPYLRDIYASTLLRMGESSAGLREITRAVADSPSLATHVYLDAKLLPWLSPAEHKAVEEGFKQALVRSYPGVAENFAQFYARIGRFGAQAALHEQAAASERDAAKKLDALIDAGMAYAQARQERDAKRLFHAAIATEPADPRAYQQLVRAVYGSKKDLAGAKETVRAGIENGAPVPLLYLSLAEAAQQAGDTGEANAALDAAKAEIEKADAEQDAYSLYLLLAEGARKAGSRDHEIAALAAAIELRPASTDVLSRLASLYAGQQQFDRAVIYYKRIAELEPGSAGVYFQLAVTEERRYHYADADKAYARAVALAPEHEAFARRYDEFKRRVAENRKGSGSTEHAVGGGTDKEIER